jgi:membrane protein YqaA with SNARE-associated domain
MRWVRRLYDWTLSWAESKHSTWALFLLAFAESSFFPVPPDVLLMALAMGKPKKSMYFAAVCSIGSVIGGMAGYYIGYEFWNLAKSILTAYGFYDKLELIGNYYRDYTAWAVAIAGFTPIPYKVFTIAGGYFRVDLLVFFIASALSRSARFFLVGGLIMIFGEKIKKFIDKYFNLLTIVFAVLLIGGFIIVKYWVE